MYQFFLAILLSFPLTSLWGQISRIPVTIPEQIKHEYPFIGDQLYRVAFSDAQGGEGYFVMTFHKEAFKKFVVDYTNEMVYNKLNKGGFMRVRDCWPWMEGYCSDFEQILSYRFVSGRPQFRSISNRFLQYEMQYDLKGLTKEVDRETDWRRGCYRDDEWIRWKHFLHADISIRQQFSFSEDDAVLKIENIVNGRLRVLFGRCATLQYGHYSQIRDETFSFPVLEFPFRFASLEPESYEFFRILTANTKRVQITEDENLYYVYFIREKS